MKRDEWVYATSCLLALSGCASEIVESTESGAEDRPGTEEPRPRATAEPEAAWSSATLSCWGHTATVVSAGRVLLIGACRVDEQAVSAALYHAERDVFEILAWPSRTVGHQATPSASGVLVTGGVPTEALDAPSDLSGEQPTTSVRFFEVASGALIERPAMTRARAFHRAAARPGGDVLVTGGLTTNADDPEVFVTATTQSYLQSEARWADGPAMDVARQRHSLVVHDGVLVACGGLGDGQEAMGVDGAAWLDRTTNVWRPLAVPAPSATGLSSSGVAVGTESGLMFVRSTDALQLADGAWTELDWQPSFWGSAATELSGGRGLIVGLGFYGGLSGVLHDSVETTMIAAPQVTNATSDWPVTLTPLDDGSVLAVGDAGASRWTPSELR